MSHRFDPFTLPHSNTFLTGQRAIIVFPGPELFVIIKEGLNIICEKNTHKKNENLSRFYSCIFRTYTSL